MNLVLKRTIFKAYFTVGHLYVDNEYFCDTIEDRDRNITDNDTIDKINKIKVKGETAIPYGTYNITLDIVSPKYSNFKKYPYVKFCNAKMPRLLNVKGFEGILIHAGNTCKDTDGCLLVGKYDGLVSVLQSQKTFIALYNKLKEAKDKGEKITIEIVKD